MLRKVLPVTIAYDNLLGYHCRFTSNFFIYSGSFGVIRDGLTHILIPNGWSWNGPASLYCPIWVEFKEDEEGD